MNPCLEYAQTVTRRQFLGNCQVGIGSIALGTLMARDAAAKPGEKTTGVPHFPARAKNVIYLHMAGSPSQLELFEHKPALVKYNGKSCPKKLLEGKQFAFIRGVPVMLGSPYRFRKHGESGTWVSSLLPYTGGVIDDLCVVKSLYTEAINHDPAITLMQTGSQQPGRASMGAWISYG